MNLLPTVLIGGYDTKTANYVSALNFLNIIPIAAFTQTNSDHSKFISSIDIADYDGLLLPGGGDMDPCLFHEANQGSKNIDLALDRMQFELLDRFVRAKKPVLGICKGLQIINVYFGGNVIQDLPTAAAHAWDKEDKVHSSVTVPNSFTHCLYGNAPMINSAHHQGIGFLGKDILISQFSFDGVTEAIYHKTLPIIAVQWHPERMCFHKKRNDTVDGKKIFEYYKDLIIHSANLS